MLTQRQKSIILKNKFVDILEYAEDIFKHTNDKRILLIIRKAESALHNPTQKDIEELRNQYARVQTELAPKG